MLCHEKKWNDWLASLTQKDKETTVTASPAE
jgi:vacuolar-type H+-ATPase subunit I/STV1